MDPAKLKWVAWSHLESDECGGLNDWLHHAPQAQPVCTLVGKLVSVDDFAIRPARGMTPDNVLSTGRYRYRFCRSPHIPHGWDAGVPFQETRQTSCVCAPNSACHKPSSPGSSASARTRFRTGNGAGANRLVQRKSFS